MTTAAPPDPAGQVPRDSSERSVPPAALFRAASTLRSILRLPVGRGLVPRRPEHAVTTPGTLIAPGPLPAGTAAAPSAGAAHPHSSLITHYSSLITRSWRLFLAPVLAVLLALAFLAAADLFLFRNALLDGLIYSRADTVTYYFPLAHKIIDSLRNGHLLLWTPYIFGGFPLFADGEGGMLYPPNLLTYLLMPERDALIWSRIIRYLLSSLFSYAYLRSLRLNGFAATVGALTYTLGSFLVMQMHHTNVGNTAIWLPLTLCMVELSVRNLGRRRWLFATAAGASVGIQALAVHIQPLLMSGLLLAFYIPFRVLLCPIAWPASRNAGTGRGDGGTGGRGEKDAGTRGHGDAETRGHGDTGRDEGVASELVSGGSLGTTPGSAPNDNDGVGRGLVPRRPEHAASTPATSGPREGEAPAEPPSPTPNPQPLTPNPLGEAPAGPPAPERLAAASYLLTQRFSTSTTIPMTSRAPSELVSDGTSSSLSASPHSPLSPWERLGEGWRNIRNRRRGVTLASVASRAHALRTGDAVRQEPHPPVSVPLHVSASPRPSPPLRVPLPLSARSSLITHYSLLITRLITHHLTGTLHRLILTGLLLGIIPGVAFGIAAVQVIPEVELGFFSFRGQGVNQVFATSYSMPVQNLINLVFPYFFRYTNRFYWSLWSEWETTLYVGIAPLVLAGVALLFVRSRIVLFYAAMAALSLLMAFGDYSPIPVFNLLHQLPGFSSLRVPGRFGMLITFSLAVMAAYGVDWLCRTLRPGRAGESSDRWRRLSRASGVHGFGLYLLALLSGAAFLVWWLAGLRMWIEKEPWAVKRLVEESYLTLRNSRPWLTSDIVLTFLNYSLDLTSEKTVISLALVLVTLLLFLAWFLFRRLWRVWASLLVLLVAADLLIFAVDFHPAVPISQLTEANSATRWLMSQNDDGLLRIYTAPEVRKTEANRLLPFRISDITGYSSLETLRHQDYMSNLAEFDKTLLDTYGARFVVLPRRFPALPSYEYTAYHPTRPLANGAAGNRGAHVTFYMNPPVKADEVSFVSSLQDATAVPQDAEVADIVVVDTTGERYTVKVKAGRDTAEWAYDRPDVTPNVGHQRPRVADKVSVLDRDGRRYQANLYFSNLHLDKTRTVERVEFHYTYPKGKAKLFGLMLWENPSIAHQVLGRYKFIPRYEDEEVLILENPSRMPRAYLVPRASVLIGQQILYTMANGEFDPEKTVLLETRDHPRAFNIPDTGIADPKVVEDWLRGNPEGSPGTAELLQYESTEVTVRTVSDRNAVLVLSDSHYPGWKALVDGREQPLLRADYLFRAVLVPAGTHEVRFVFEPDSFYIGADISTFTVGTLLVLWAGLILVFPALRWSTPRLISRIRRLRFRRTVTPDTDPVP